MGEWDRARRAYRALIADVDPAADEIGRLGALDLRPGGHVDTADAYRAVVVSGPADLVELREIVESITGTGTWPAPLSGDGELRRATLRLDRPAGPLALVDAMGELIEDRGGMWRTWKTVVELVGARLTEIDSLTVEARVIERGRVDPGARRRW